MGHFFLDLATERNLLDEAAQRRQRLAIQASRVTPRMGQLAESWADAYPWMDPTAVQSFVQAGVPPDTPQAQSVADLAARDAAARGDFDDPTDDVSDGLLGTLANAVLGVAKPLTRSLFTILMTPIDELRAFAGAEAVARAEIAARAEATGEPVDPNPITLLSRVWELYTGPEGAGHSPGLRALGALIRGETVDLGEGILPGGEIMEAFQAERQAFTFEGHAVTPGRMIARSVLEPGTKPWQMMSGIFDVGTFVFLDPVVHGGRALAAARKAHETFNATGIISGLTRTVDPEVAVRAFLTSQKGQDRIRWFTQNQDFSAAWRATGKADAGVAQALVDSTTDARTFEILSDVLGTVVRRPQPGFVSSQLGGAVNDYGRLFGAGAGVSHSLRNTRIFRLGAEIPRREGVSHLQNVNDTALQLERFMVNARVPVETRNQVLSQVAKMTPGSEPQFLSALEAAMSATEGVLTRTWGISPSRAKRMTRLFADRVDDLRAYNIDDAGRHVDVLRPLRLNVGGKTVDFKPLPGTTSELLNNVVVLPDFREIRRATPTIRQLRWALDSGLWRGSANFMDSVMYAVWKPLQLLRGAWNVRVIADEQARMAAAGLGSLFDHPISAIAWNLSIDPKSRLGRYLASQARKVIDPKGTQTVTGQIWREVPSHQGALERGSAGWRGMPGEVITGNFVRVNQGETGFFRGWATELTHQANDPTMRRVAGGLDPGDLRTIGRTQSTGDQLEDVLEWWWRGTGQAERKLHAQREGFGRLLTDREATREYLRQNYFDRQRQMTGGNPDLVDGIARGRIGKINLEDWRGEEKLMRLLEDVYGQAAPSWVKMPVAVSGPKRGQWDRFVEMSFDFLMTKPTNWLSRSPTYRKLYYQEMERLIPFADRATQEAMIRGARAANVGKAAEKRMAAQALKGEGSKITSLDRADDLAKGFALRETRSLLYDLNRRNQLFEQMRLVWPFGEAWREIIGTWTRLASPTRQPHVLRRFQQGLDGATTPSIFGELETETSEGRGFFYPDETTGELIFNYPAAWVGKLLGLRDEDAGVGFVGRARGVNLVAASAVPGFGPILQIPANWIIPPTATGWAETLRDLVMPFGAPEAATVPGQIIESFQPAWMKKVFTVLFNRDPDNTRLYANTIADVMGGMVAQDPDRWSIGTLADQQELLDEATRRARALYLIRGAAQFAVPTGPELRWTTHDLEGNIWPVRVLSDELRRMTDEEYDGDWDTAFREFLRRFGQENVLAIVAKTTSLVQRPVTEKGDAWLRAHQDLEREFPLTVGLYAPEPTEGEFDYAAYLRSLQRGDRVIRTPAEQIAYANEYLGRITFERAKQVAEMRPGITSSLWLGEVREQIAAMYPGFNAWGVRKGRDSRPQPDEMIREIRAAAQNEVLAQTDAGQGIRLYLTAIDMADLMVARLPGNVTRYQQARAARPIREWLRLVAQAIIAQHPDFARVWINVFERELASDDEPIGGILP